MNESIIVEALIQAPLEKVWHDYTDPRAIMAWNAASDDWHTTKVENDVRTGGAFMSRMEAKDGSVGFDFTGTYDEVIPQEKIAYTMTDGRNAVITFAPVDGAVKVVVTFDPETENPQDMQRAGWQAILDSFKKYCEEHAA